MSVMNSFQLYTCGFMFDSHGKVLLVQKARPKWQIGRLNGIGGKNETFDSPMACMIREWKEETQNDHADWTHVCSLSFPEARVDFFKAIVDVLPRFPQENDTGESLLVVEANSLPDSVIPNLKWLIPLCLDPNAYGLGSALKEAIR